MALAYRKKKSKINKMKVKDLPLEADDSQSMKPANKPVDKRTRAQKTFDKVKERRQAEKVLKKVEKTHRERVREFNQHLDTLTEHFDIQKVSWTK
jgi:protein FAM32A